MINIYLYTRYERFWHWLQTALILLLVITGFEINGQFSLFGFKTAAAIHNYCGITWLIAFVFFVFWVLTTGEWRQYVPTTKKMVSVIQYYAYGIFRGRSHPVPKRKEAKHNPLQRIVYLLLAALLLPIQMITGLLYWGYNSWEAWGIGGFSLYAVATIHLACGFAIVAFIIVHVYMITTGHTLFAHTRAMLSGWELISEEAVIEDWERKDRRRPTPTV